MQVSGQFSPGVYGQLAVAADGELDFGYGWGIDQFHAILAANINSPGWTTPACPANWTFTKDSVLTQVGSGLGNALNWALEQSFDAWVWATHW